METEGDKRCNGCHRVQAMSFFRSKNDTYMTKLCQRCRSKSLKSLQRDGLDKIKARIQSKKTILKALVELLPHTNATVAIDYLKKYPWLIQLVGDNPPEGWGTKQKETQTKEH